MKKLVLAALGVLLASPPAWSLIGEPQAVPPVVITSPATGSFTNKTTSDVTVSFSAFNEGLGKAGSGNVKLIELLVNGIVVASFNNPPEVKSGTHTFSGIELSAFANTGVPVIFTARAFHGDSKAGLTFDSAQVSVIVDTIPPKISNLTPADGSFTNNPKPPISALVTDTGGSGVGTVVVSLDGAQVPATVTLTDPNSANVSFTPTSPLAQGTHTLVIVAMDRATNTTTVSASFIVDLTPPVITITVSPTDPMMSTKTTTVKFTDDLSGVAKASRVILVDVVDQTSAGQFLDDTWVLTKTFGIGTHSIVAQARDGAGNFGQATATFEVTLPAQALDIRPPTVSLIFPTLDFTKVAGTTLPVIVQAKDDFDALDTGVATVDLIVNGQIVQTQTAAQAIDFFWYVFQLPLTGNPGSTLAVKVRATDGAGNTAETSTTTITLAPVPSPGPVALRIDPIRTVTAGEPFSVTITPVDASGNPVSGFTAPVGLQAGPIFSTFIFFNGTQTSITVPISSGLTQRGVQAITAVSFNNFAVTGAEAIDVLAAAPATVTPKLLGYQFLAQGTPLTQLGATVMDAFGNTVPNATVTWNITFTQNGTPVGQTTLTVNTNGEGIAQVPAIPVPQNATDVSAVATVLTPSGTIQGTFASPVVPDVIFNIAFQHQAVEAGQPVSLTITAIDPTTGAVKKDFTGTVFLYRYNELIPTGGPRKGRETFSVTFSAANQGVLFVNNGIVLTGLGDQVLAASTVAPVLTPFPAGLDIAQPAIQTIGGVSNELVVLPSEPTQFSSLSVQIFPVVAFATLVDRFNNPIFNQPVRFDFVTNGVATPSFVATTDILGHATGYGSMDLSVAVANSVSVTATAVNFPMITATATSSSTPSSFGGASAGSTSPSLIQLGKTGQPVSDLSLTITGQSCDPFVTVGVGAFLQGEGFGPRNVSFSRATVVSSQLVATGPVSIQGASISVAMTNRVALNPGKDQNGNCIPANFSYTAQIVGITVDVPDAQEIILRHQDGRLNADAGDVRTIALFDHVMTFGGTFIPNGRPELTDPTTGQSLAGVFIIDSEDVSRTMVGNPSLTTTYPVFPMGAFNVRVIDQTLTSMQNLKILLESETATGGPLLDPATGQPRPGTKVLLPLQSDLPSGTTVTGTGPAPVMTTGPVVPTDLGFVADESIGGISGQVVLTSQSSVPADGQTQAKVSIRVTYPDGTSASGSFVTLMQTSTSSSATIVQPAGPTDATGMATGFVSSTFPGTVALAATVTAPTLDAQHVGFTVDTSSTPVKMLFFTNIQTITVVPGGKFKATLVQIGTNGSTTPVQSFPFKEAFAVGVQVDIQPEGETAFRPAPYSIVKGTMPTVRFSFLPNVGVFNITAQTGVDLFRPTFGLALVLDDGFDETSIDRGTNPNQRINPMTGPGFGVDRAANTITWSVQPGQLRVGTNRIKATFIAQVPEVAQTLFNMGAGPALAVARILNYLPADPNSDFPQDLIGPSRPFLPVDTGFAGETLVRDEILAFFNSSSSDLDISASLFKFRLAPTQLYRTFGLLVGRCASPSNSMKLSTISAALRTLTNPSTGMPIADIALENIVGEKNQSNACSEDVTQALLHFYDSGTGSFVNSTTIDESKAAVEANVQHFFIDTFAANQFARFCLPQIVQSPPTICIIDTGFGDGTNPLNEFRPGQLLPGLNYTPTAPPPPPPARRDIPIRNAPLTGAVGIDIRDLDTFGHGTHLLHLSSANGAAYLGTGRDASVLPVRAFKETDAAVPFIIRPMVDPEIAIDLATAQQAILAAINTRGVRIINCSWNASWKHTSGKELEQEKQTQVDKTWEMIRKEAAAKGVIIVKSVGDWADLTVGGAATRTSTMNRIGDVSQSAIPQRGGGGTGSTTVLVGGTRIEDSPREDASEKVDFLSNAGGNDISSINTWIAAPSRGIKGVAFGFPAIVRDVEGTSGSAAMVSGLLGEMIWLAKKAVQFPVLGGTFNWNPDAGLASNKEQFALQMIEVLGQTSDQVWNPSTNTLVPTVVGQPDPLVGHGRINAWKALLAIANLGVSDMLTPSELRFYPTLATTVPRIDDEHTRWYGFRIRTQVQGAMAMLVDGTSISDNNVPHPIINEAGNLNAYKRVVPKDLFGLPGRVPGEIILDPNTGQPVVSNPQFILQFTISRSVLPSAESVGTILSIVDPAGSVIATINTNLLLRRNMLPAGQTSLGRPGTNIQSASFRSFVFDITLTK